jgi:GNAT superfamily N-acetyltransferase
MCGCEKNIKTFENGGNIDNKDVVLYDIVDLDGSIIEKNLTEEDLIEWANTYDWYDLMDVSDDFPVGKIDNLEDAIKSIQGVENEGDYTVVKKDLVDSEFENGGVIESFRRFTEGDFNRLTYDDFEGRLSGYVWVIKHKDSSKILGKFNPKKNTLFILGKKDLTNPLVKWLQQNSFVSSDEYRKLEKGGKISKNKNWIADALSGGKNKGALRRTAMRKGLLRNEDEKLSMTDLHKLEKVGGKTSKRAYFAETLRKFDNGGELESKINHINLNYDGVTASKIENDNRIRVVSPYFNTLSEIKRNEFNGSGFMEKYGNTSSYVLYSNQAYFDNGGEIKDFSPKDNYVNLKYIENGKELGHLNYEYDKDGVFSVGLNDYPYNYKNELYIDNIDVDKDNRNKGIAKKLLKRAIEDAKKLGINIVTLKRDSGLGCNYGSDYDNYLKSLYLSIGFFETWTLKDSEESFGEKNICGMHLNVIDERWGNDGSTPSNNEDYNRLYAFFPDNHSQAKYIWNQLSDKQKSGFIYDLEVTDAASEHIAESWLEFINSSSQDDYWENATNWDEMKNGGEVGGRGWGDFEKGAKISSLKDVKVGELYLDYNNFFNSKNIILIASGDTTGLNRDIVYASFVRPNNLKGREETFAIWGHDLEEKIDLYKIEGRKYEFGGNVDLDIYPDEDLRYTNRKIKKSKEALVRENIYNGEIQEYILKTIIGKEPEYPIQIIGSLKLTKCFLRPYYKI